MPWFHIQDPYYKHWPGIHGICRTIHVVLFPELFLPPPPKKKKTRPLQQHRIRHTPSKSFQATQHVDETTSKCQASAISDILIQLPRKSKCLSLGIFGSQVDVFFENRFFYKQWWWCWENICLGGNISGRFFCGIAFLNQKFASFKFWGKVQVWYISFIIW